MFEMEIKVCVDNVEDIKEKLLSEGAEVLKTSVQFDRIYERKGDENKKGVPVFRIRKCDEQIYLTLKILEEDINTAREYELMIDDEYKMHEILSILGYNNTVNVQKTRESFAFKDYLVCLDTVNNLGNFMEIEKISYDSNRKTEVYEEMRKLLFNFGFCEKDFVKKKYYEMIRNKDDIGNAI